MSENVRASNRPQAVQEEADAEDWLGTNQDPDVLLSVPDLSVDKISLSVEELHADVDLHARVLKVVELRVGATVDLRQVQLDIENVRTQAILKVKLDKIREIVDRVLTTIDNNPELITSVTAPVGRAAEELAPVVHEKRFPIRREATPSHVMYRPWGVNLLKRSREAARVITRGHIGGPG